MKNNEETYTKLSHQTYLKQTHLGVASELFVRDEIKWQVKNDIRKFQKEPEKSVYKSEEVRYRCVHGFPTRRVRASQESVYKNHTNSLKMMLFKEIQ